MSLVSPPSAEGVIEELSADPVADDLFAQALRDDSNLEMDWLWIATKVLTDGQRAYCLRRALRINPQQRTCPARIYATTSPTGKAA